MAREQHQQDGDQNQEEQRRNGVPRDAVRRRPFAAPQDEQARHRQRQEPDRHEDEVGQNLLKCAEHHEQRSEGRLNCDRSDGRAETGMYNGDGFEEHAVARHRVVDSRPRQHHGADARRKADDREHGQHAAGDKSEQPLGDDVEQPAAAGQRGELVDGHRVDVREVEREIDHDDGQRADGERHGHVSSWIANFLGHVSGGVPA